MSVRVQVERPENAVPVAALAVKLRPVGRLQVHRHLAALLQGLEQPPRLLLRLRVDEEREVVAYAQRGRVPRRDVRSHQDDAVLQLQGDVRHQVAVGALAHPHLLVGVYAGDRPAEDAFVEAERLPRLTVEVEVRVQCLHSLLLTGGWPPRVTVTSWNCLTIRIAGGAVKNQLPGLRLAAVTGPSGVLGATPGAVPGKPAPTRPHPQGVVAGTVGRV